jgi:hypothetical protein
MTNSSGFGQTEEEKVKTASNLASTSNNLRNSTAAQEYLTGIQYREGGTGSLTSETDDLKTTYLPDQSFGDQALLQELTNKQNMLNMEVAAELDRVNTEFFTDLDIRKAQSIAGETRAGQRVSGEERRAELAEGGAQTRATSRVAGQEQRAGYAEQGSQERATGRVMGQEQRAGYAEQGSQLRATERVKGQEDRGRTAEEGQQTRATSRVAGQEQRAGIAEEGSQTRGTRRVEGQEVRETDLQREMFRRYKESRDYDQAQRGARSY